MATSISDVRPITHTPMTTTSTGGMSTVTTTSTSSTTAPITSTAAAIPIREEKLVPAGIVWRWVDNVMKREGGQMAPGWLRSKNLEDPSTDFIDGVRLIRLIETLSGHRASTPFHLSPSGLDEYNSVDNIRIAFRMLRAEGLEPGFKPVYLYRPGPQRLHLLTDLLWRILLHFRFYRHIVGSTELGRTEERTEVSKMRLIEWIREKTAPFLDSYRLKRIENLYHGWDDGLVYLILLHAYDPTIVTSEMLRTYSLPGQRNRSLMNAASLAKRHLGIPKLIITPEGTIDEHANIAYLAEFWLRFHLRDRDRGTWETVPTKSTIPVTGEIPITTSSLGEGGMYMDERERSRREQKRVRKLQRLMEERDRLSTSGREMDTRLSAAEEERLRAEQLRIRAEMERKRAEEERYKALEARRKAEQDKELAEEEVRRAMTGRHKAEQDRIAAEQEARKALERREHALREKDRLESERRKADEERRDALESIRRSEVERLRVEQERKRLEDEVRMVEQERIRALSFSKRAEEDRFRLEEELRLSESERSRADEIRRYAQLKMEEAERERHRAAEERRLAREEMVLAEQEMRIAEEERRKAEVEKQIAEQERLRVDLERILYEREGGIRPTSTYAEYHPATTTATPLAAPVVEVKPLPPVPMPARTAPLTPVTPIPASSQSMPYTATRAAVAAPTVMTTTPVVAQQPVTMTTQAAAAPIHVTHPMTSTTATTTTSTTTHVITLEEKKRRKAERKARRAEEERLQADRLRKKEEKRRLRAEDDKKRLEAYVSMTQNVLVGVVHVSVVEARGLGTGVYKPYAKVKLEKQKMKTKSIKKTLIPQWRSDFMLYHTDPDARLKIRIYDKGGRFGHKRFIGRIDIPVRDIDDGIEQDMWYPLHYKVAREDKLRRKQKRRRERERYKGWVPEEVRAWRGDEPLGEVRLKLLYRRDPLYTKPGVAVK